ncbi:Alpha/Beta hydrolase protein [Dactylonectria estremocensis]|uniref:Alpha/Beta hydrolase protein n=1 Tax=Dactylonectria estremocensis TaxID=1079267 RepID=A0A9P9EMY0_9HYPO|nr:Alpha/Beta hydrolase protein [Dactylonectria estremocensis]
MTEIKPYHIHIHDDKIDRLKQKLAFTDFPDEDADLEQDSWVQGPPVGEIKRLAEAWRVSFDWRQVEAKLNELPHFIAGVNVDTFGLFNVHFVHKRSSKPKAIPLLFLHGWPGSFHEVSRILDPLVQGGAEGSPVFDVVAPSLIDFGFSSASKKGFQVEHHAEAYHKLMQMLGYYQYVIQAGDVGSVISRFMAKNFGPSQCKAHHVNTPAPSQPTQERYPELYAKMSVTPLTDMEQKGLARAGQFQEEGSGYYKVQSTKPTTIGYSIRDSPVGLLAWIYEKLHDWGDAYPWTDEEILTWVSIHYFSTAGPEATSNIYYAMEHSQPPAFAAAAGYIDVPLGISRFSNDLVLLPKLWNQTLGPIVFENEHQNGGHFAAWERPDAIVEDLRTMFRDCLMEFKTVKIL